MNIVGRHDLPNVQSKRKFTHKGFFPSQKSTHVVCQVLVCRFDFSAPSNVRCRDRHLKGGCQPKYCFRSPHYLRDHIASHKLSLMVKQHGRSRCKACTETAAIREATSFAKTSHYMSHQSHFFLLRSSHRSFPSFVSRFISVKHLLSRQSWICCHHVRPPRLLRPNLSPGIVASHLQQTASHQTFLPKMDGLFRPRRGEQIFTAGFSMFHQGLPCNSLLGL